MISPKPVQPQLQDKTFLLLLVAASLAFALILWPFYGAVLWAVVFAIVFAPLYRRLYHSLRQRPTLAALATVVIVVFMVILPLTLIIAALVDEASGIYRRIQSGDVNFARYFQQIFQILPSWAANLLNQFGLTNLSALQERLSTALTEGSQFLISQAINIGQNTFQFLISLVLMLYLLFFLLRDGSHLARRIKAAVPLRAEQQAALFNKFITVIRATVKGTLVVALLQGALGGLILWILGIHAALLWAVIMAIAALVPAVGAALVWVPITLYLLLTGSIWQGIVLAAYGVLVISLVDNFVRPILIGKDTKMPDYVALISTLGGISLFGIHGFVIGPVIAAMFIAIWDIFSTPS